MPLMARYAPSVTTMPSSQPTAANGSSWLGGFGDFADKALGAYLNYEAVKAGKATTGQQLADARSNPTPENGAAVQVAAPVQTPQQQQAAANGGLFGTGIDQKTALMFATVLALVLVAKRLG